MKFNHISWQLFISILFFFFNTVKPINFLSSNKTLGGGDTQKPECLGPALLACCDWQRLEPGTHPDRRHLLVGQHKFWDDNCKHG